jgi:hypothetical protein
MIQKIANLLGFAPWSQVYELQRDVSNLEELCERRLRACRSLEKQKTAQYLHIQLLDKEISSMREQLNFWSEGKA